MACLVILFFLFSSPELAQGELLGYLNVRRLSSVRFVVVVVVVVNNFLVNTLAATVLTKSSSNLLRVFVLMISRSSSIMGGMGSTSRSLGQILEKSCLYSSSNISGPIFLKLAQNVCLNDILVKLNHWWDGVNK